MDAVISRDAIQEVVLRAMTLANETRSGNRQLEVSPTAPIFGPSSSLDSLSLVALLIDVEDMLRDIGIEATLGDERAMSQRRSPFRDVPALVAYIETVASAPVL